MEAWSGYALPVKYVRAETPLERQGALVFQAKQCRNCHMVGGMGGQRGPVLDNVATRLTEPQLVRQVLQGGGNMPAYGKNLSPAETNALVRFLETMHPLNERPASDPSAQGILREASATPDRGSATFGEPDSTPSKPSVGYHK